MRLITYLLILIASLCTVPAFAGDYHLGVGDIVSINVYGHPDMQVDEARVDGNGNIAVPLVGEISVVGLTPNEARKRVSLALEKGGYIIKPNVNLLVQKYMSKQASVLGNVNQPGKYALESATTVSDLLALAGGIGSHGSDTVILLHKVGDQVTRTPIDTIALFKEGKTNLDYAVDSGDILYVPQAEVFYIYGEVQHPGAFRLEKNMNIMEAISLGGGITPRGTERGVEIRRQDGADGKISTTKPTPSELLQPNDVVYVKESLF